MISSHRDGAKLERFHLSMNIIWNGKILSLLIKELGENPNSQQVLIEGLLKPKQFLDIIQNFIIFEIEEGRTIKKIARYQQYRAVQKTISRLKSP